MRLKREGYDLRHIRALLGLVTLSAAKALCNGDPVALGRIVAKFARMRKTVFDIGVKVCHTPYNNVLQECSMEVALKKMGNSTAVVIPPPVLKDLGIGAGQHLTLDTTADGKIVLSPKRKYVLADMIAQCDQNAAPPADLALWDVARPVGGEVI